MATLNKYPYQGENVLANQRFAFVLRLWMEDTADEADASLAVRGSLQAVDSERVQYFSSFEGLPDLLREITGWRSVDLDQQEA